ncbi:unnamed protein product [Rotaria socialis]
MEAIRNDFYEQFSHVAIRYSKQPCLITENGDEISYKVLSSRVNSLYASMCRRGVRPGQYIGIYLERGTNVFVSILASLACRTPFLLLEHSIPSRRLKAILDDAKPIVMITEELLECNLQKFIEPDRIFRPNNECYESAPFTPNRPPFQPNDPLYIMYTSGSSGTPKGVIVSHRAIWNRFKWMWNAYPWTANDRQLWKTSVTFVDSIWEMLGGLLQGIPTVMASSAVSSDPFSLSYLIDRRQVTRLTVVPTMLSSILKAFPDSTTCKKQLRSLKLIIFSGEKLTKNACALFRTFLPQVILLNLYGSTETGNDATYHEITDALNYSQFESIPIGKPIGNVDYALLNSQGQLSTDVGELLIAGECLFTAYLNLPELTASKHISIDGKTYFRTGDLVRLDQTTQMLIFLARVDSQIKIRGCRVELEEIETVLNQHPAVTASGCFVAKIDKEQLVAFYTSNKLVEHDELVDWLSSSLPSYALPKSYIRVDTIPYTTTSKLDRAQLSVLYARYQSEVNGEAFNSTDDIQSLVFPMWCKILDVANATDARTRTFTQLGGHSLLAIQIQRELYSHYHVHIPIRHFFANLTLLGLCKLVDEQSAIGNMFPCQSAPASTLRETEFPTVVPLSVGQQGIWIDDEMSNDIKAKYNIEATYKIVDQRITTAFVLEAVRLLVERHHSLRTVFERDHQGNIVQAVKPLVMNTVNGTPILIVRAFSAEQPIELELTQFLCQKFQLEQSKPCFLCYLITIDDRPHVLSMIFHHIIVDGWSIGVIIHELNQILQALIDKIAPNLFLPPIQWQFHQYLIQLNTAMWEKDVAYWKEILSNGTANYAILPLDRQSGSDIDGSTYFCEISPKFASQLHLICQTMDVTPFMVLLSTFSALIARYTGNWEDIIVATPVFNRYFEEIEHTVGLFVNTLLMRFDLSADPTFHELVDYAKKTVLEAFEHQQAPFAYVTSQLEQLERDSHASRLFQVIFAYQNVGEKVNSSLMSKMRVIDPTAKCDLEVHVWEDDQGGLSLQTQYRTNLFKASTIERLICHWLQLCEAAFASLDTRMSHWPMMTDDEQTRLINEFSYPSVSDSHQPLEKTLCQLFCEQANACPEAIAIEHNGQIISYAQLWKNSIQAASTITRRLLAANRGDEKLCIAIMAYRSIKVVQTMWSVLLAGHYYINIDPDLPFERKAWILRETHAFMLVTDLVDTIDEDRFKYAIPIITHTSLLNTDVAYDIDSVQNAEAKVLMAPNDLAYIIFTSGSTGIPKGVCATHKNIICRTVGVGCHSIKPGYRVGQVCSLSFDVSTFEIFATLLNGGTLVIVDCTAIASCSALEELHLDMLNPPTAVFNILSKQAESSTFFPTLNSVIFAGEKANLKCVQAVSLHPPLTLMNGYGPTETTHNALCYTVTSDVSQKYFIPIGRPLPNTQVYVVDNYLQLVPIGVPGELLIGGAGVSAGYFNDAALTMKKFVPNPFVSKNINEECELIYRTGDTVRMLEDGNVEFLYRKDNQVKIRSQRIEIGEIETRLLEIKALSEAVVILRNDILDDATDDSQHIVAYVVPREGFHITEDAIRFHLAQWLPHHMIPSFIVILEKMPINSIGKINRKLLPKPTIDKRVSTTVFNILTSVLKQPEFPRTANFIQLGGHSLLAMEVVARIHRAFNIITSVRQLFQCMTLEDYANQIEQTVASQELSIISTMATSTDEFSTARQQLPLLPAQRQFWFLWKMKPNNPCYNVPVALDINGDYDQTVLFSALYKLMTRHELLRTVYKEDGGGSVWQHILAQWMVPLIEVNLNDLSQLTERLQFYASQPFDLNKGPVCRFVIIHIHDIPNHHVLLVNFHHILCDGYSIEYFLDELARFYDTENNDKASRQSVSSLIHFISNQSKNNNKDKLTAIGNIPQLDQILLLLTDLFCYVFVATMVERIKGHQRLPLTSDMTIDKSKNSVELNHPAYISYVDVIPILADKLRTLSKTFGCTLFTLLLALYKCVLSVFSNDHLDILVGSVLSTRTSQDNSKDLFAPLINTLALRTILPEDDHASMTDIVERVKETVLIAIENQACSFTDIISHLRSINELRGEQKQPFLPLFRVLFEMNFYNLLDWHYDFKNGSRWVINAQSDSLLPFTKSDIDMHASEKGQGSPIDISFRANTRLLSTKSIEKLAQCYAGAIELVIREPNCTKSYLWSELHMIRSGLTIHECFIDQVQRNPSQIAIIQGDLRWSYEQLHRQAMLVAISLQTTYFLHPGALVGLCMRRSADLVASMFGVLTAGATYVYLDPALPVHRILKMIELASCKLVLCDVDGYQVLNSSNNNITECSLINTLDQVKLDNKMLHACVKVKPTDVCYVIFTSGTTGEPKGIRIQHQAVVRRTHMHDYLRITPSSRVAHVSSCSFDGYILELYAALLNGASVVVYDHTYTVEPKLLGDLFRIDKITHAYLPTPIFNMMAEYVPSAFSGMISVMSAGDRANAKLMRQVLLQSRPPPQQLVNAYGPTETTCISTWYYVTLPALNNIIAHGLSVPIGTALPDTPIYIVRSNTLELVDEGELLIGGFGVSHGYLSLPEQTAAKFIATNPFSTTDQRPLYRSGDSVRRLSDGNLVFIGRYDNQVKIEGCRIELAEIESNIKNHPDVLDAVVIVRSDIVKDAQTIVAYVKPEIVSPTAIKHYLSKNLPKYMIPTFVIPIATLPLVGGKIDRNNLPKPNMSADVDKDNNMIISTKKTSYNKIEDVWHHILGHDRIFKPQDDFFQSGGTSFSVVQLHAMLEVLFDIKLDIIKLFEYTTIESQLQWIVPSKTIDQYENIQVPMNTISPSIRVQHQCFTNEDKECIAVIGMSARYGTVETIEDLWTILCNGSDLCTHVSHNELRQQEHMAEMLKLNPNYVQARCVMPNANCFDHIFFDMTKRDADITDPQHRIMLETAYEALEDAGLVPQNFSGTIGIFGSTFRNTYAETCGLFKPYTIDSDSSLSVKSTTLDPASILRVEIGNMAEGAPTFVAYKLGLTGPAMAVQTACSSSGTALHVALRSIETGDCDVALVAGVCIDYPLEAGYNYQPGMIMSKTGYCRAFDARADGAVSGDGAGVIVLMKLQEAILLGYSIRALIIGHAINNDGYKKSSFSITNPDMQAACMKKALKMAQIERPTYEIGFVEAHGPGIPLGDLLEVQALTKAYDNNSTSASKIYLGSIKTNVGHTGHAGTLASLIKTILILESGKIPPTVYFQQFSPLIAQLNHPFIVNSTCVNWPQSPRRAAVNTLGQGGTNSHFILEQFVPKTKNELSHMPSQQIFVFSAKDSDALNQVKHRLAAHLSKFNSTQRDRIAYALAFGRMTYNVRGFIVASSIEQLKQKLIVPQHDVRQYDTPINIVFLLPGQGTQFFGMAYDLYTNYPICAKIIDQCCNFIQNSAIRQMVIDSLLKTKEVSSLSNSSIQYYAQLSVFIVEYALASLFIALNVKPNFFIGHSTGELVAACLAQVFTLEQAICFLEYRWEVTVNISSSHGSMLAVHIDEDVELLQREFDVEISAINSKNQYVFSGTHSNIKRMEEQLRLQYPTNKMKNLQIASAFHSSFMNSACEKLEKWMTCLVLKEPSFPIVSTVTGMLTKVGEMTSIDYWISHLKKPVLFGPAVENLLMNSDKPLLFVQVGPGKNLLSLVQNIDSNSKIAPPTLLENEGGGSVLNCVGTLWSHGATKDIHWTALFHSSHMHHISLPKYPFKRVVCVADTHQITTHKNWFSQSRSSCMSRALGYTTTSSLKASISSKSISSRAPWTVRKLKNNTECSSTIKLIQFDSNTNFDSEVAIDVCSLRLGFSTSIFTRALYFDAIQDKMIKPETLLIDLFPESLLNDLPDHVTRLTLQQLADGSSGLVLSSCESVQDLLNSLVSSTTSHKSTNDNSDIIGMSLLGHSLAAINEMSYSDLVHEKFIRPLLMCSTSISGNEAYAPALGLQSTTKDMGRLLMAAYGTSTNTDASIRKSIQKAFENYSVSLTGTEQLVPVLHMNTNQALLIISIDHVKKSMLESIVEKTFGVVSPTNISHKDVSDYTNIIIECLRHLMGNSTSMFSVTTPFDQLGVDSLQAITLVDVLSRQLENELPVDIIYKYSTIEKLSHELQERAKLANSTSIASPGNYILDICTGMPKVYHSVNDRSLSALLQFITHKKSQLLNELTEYGALLFRHFDVITANHFAQVAQALAITHKSFLDYKDGISKRTHVMSNVFTSTEYPKHVEMALHNEMSYATEMPSQIFFFAEIPPAPGCGGETPIGDSREIYRSIDRKIRNAFANRKILYVHNMPNLGQGLGKSWQDTYRTESRKEVEEFLCSRHIEFSWQPDGSLRTIRSMEAVKRHPLTGDWLWCNHAHLFHPSDLQPELRRTLESRLTPVNMPKNCFFADNGEVIPDNYLTHVRHVLQAHQTKWSWERGDVLLLDNYRVAHGRAAFSGERRILVAMC